MTKVCFVLLLLTLPSCGYFLGIQERSTASIQETIGPFEILGVTGGTDATVDSALTNGTIAQISWAPATNATDYEVVIRNLSDTADICPLQTVTSTSATFSSCSLVNLVQYKVIARAKNDAGLESAATNGPFTFVVDNTISFSRTELWVSASQGHPIPLISLLKDGVAAFTFSVLSGLGLIDSMGGTATPAPQRDTAQIQVQDTYGLTTTLQMHTLPIRTNGTVYKIIENAGSIYIAGDFTGINPNRAPYMTSLNVVSGDLDPSSGFSYVTSGFDGQVQALEVHEGYAYVGGQFTTYRGSPAPYLAKVNLFTGELDTTFTQAAGLDGGVTSVVISGNKLFVGGWFTTYRSAPALSLAKLDLVTGNLDTVFTQASGFVGWIRSLAVTSTDVYAVGPFATYRGAPAAHIAKLNQTTGNLDTAFTQATTTDLDISAILVHGTSLYIGGRFSTYRSAPANSIAKLDLITGNLDPTFNPGTGTAGGWVYALAASGNSLYLSGAFSVFAGAPVESIAKVDLTTGVLDTTFSQPTGAAGGFGNVEALAVCGTGLCLGGDFRTYRGAPANSLAKIDLVTGNLDTTFTKSPGVYDSNVFGPSVRMIHVEGERVHIGGQFTSYGGEPAKFVAKLDSTTMRLDRTFTLGNEFEAGSYVQAIAIAGSSLYVGGNFSTYRGATVENLLKLDLVTGANDVNFTTGTNSTVTCLAECNGSLCVAGQFSTYRGSTANSLAKVDLSTGALDTAFTQATGFPAFETMTSLVASGTSLYVAGSFSVYRGQPALRLAKLNLANGNLDTAFTQATGANSSVTDLAISGTSLYFSGAFTTYRGAPALGLAKVSTSNGNLDVTFTQATGASGGSIIGLALAGTSVYILGDFVSYRGTAANHIAKLNSTNGNLDTAFTSGSGFAGENLWIQAISAGGSSIYVGGRMSSYRDLPIQGMTKIDLATGALLD